MIARVFPRRTKATPTDDMAFIGEPPLFPVPCDGVHISVAFSWDLREADRLARSWSHVAPVVIGGPATGERGDDFDPGLYVKRGYVITSRGCPNNCWFCSVPKREGPLRELPVTEGWNVLDDNLLACSESHVREVFAMLKRQPQRAEFTGGLEAARLKDWHVDLLYGLRPKQMFFAYDTPDDWEPLVVASSKLIRAGINPSSHSLRAYVLIGFPKDTMDDAERRLTETAKLGVMPMAMLWRDVSGKTDVAWRRLQRKWARPSMMANAMVSAREEAR